MTIVGEPGVGKSRLCAELFGYIDERPELVTWRQGRCLPYGEGIAFWALGEIVKAECGILESDSPDEAEAKLERAVPADDPDRIWLAARLAPLVGAPAEPASQEESFTAWRRFLEALASEGPTVLVVRGPALGRRRAALLPRAPGRLVAGRAAACALLRLVPSCRRPIRPGRPGCATRRRSTSPRLTDEETARLIGSLLERSVLPAETQRALLERAGGNPLYAEEFVRLLSDSGELGEAVEVPDSVQALIAARLDTLSPERKSLLQDASVIGKLFWAGALAEMGDRDAREVELALHELSRKELVRRSPTSAMRDEAEYGFWHLLVRDVCYAQIPRAARAARHRAAAAWLEHQAGERAEDLADVLAYHYLSALELTRAAGQAEQAEELEANAIRYLALAGERALPLDVGRAEASLAKALALAPAGHPERASLLERWAQAAQQQNRLQEARAALEEALALYREQDASVAAGRALTALSSCAGAAWRPARGGAARRGAGAARGGAARPRARRRLRRAGGVARRRRRLQGGDRGRRAGARPRRRARPARAGPRARPRGVRPAPTWGNGRGSRTCAGRSRSRSSRARAAPRPSCTTTSRSPSGSTRGRGRHWMPAGRGSTSASGAASPSSRSRSPP